MGSNPIIPISHRLNSAFYIAMLCTTFITALFCKQAFPTANARPTSRSALSVLLCYTNGLLRESAFQEITMTYAVRSRPV